MEYSVGFPDILVEIDSKYLKFELCNKNKQTNVIVKYLLDYDNYRVEDNGDISIFRQNKNVASGIFGGVEEFSYFVEEAIVIVIGETNK